MYCVPKILLLLEKRWTKWPWTMIPDYNLKVIISTDLLKMSLIKLIPAQFWDITLRKLFWFFCSVYYGNTSAWPHSKEDICEPICECLSICLHVIYAFHSRRVLLESNSSWNIQYILCERPFSKKRFSRFQHACAVLLFLAYFMKAITYNIFK